MSMPTLTMPTLTMPTLAEDSLKKIMSNASVSVKPGTVWHFRCVLNPAMALVNKDWRAAYFKAGRETFLEHVLAAVLEVGLGDRRGSVWLRFVVYHPAPRVGWTVAFCNKWESTQELNIWLIHRERGRESAVATAFRFGNFRMCEDFWIRREDLTAENRVVLEAWKTAATATIGEWLAMAFWEVTEAHATCVPEYMAVTERACVVDRYIARGIGDVSLPLLRLYMAAKEKYWVARRHQEHIRDSWYDTADNNTKRELQTLIVAVLRTAMDEALADYEHAVREIPAQRKLERALKAELWNLRMWSSEHILWALNRGTDYGIAVFCV